MEIIKLEATVRSQSGKAKARRVRREGNIPAVAYGKGLGAIPIAISPQGLDEIMKSIHGQNTVVEIGVDGGKQKITALLREYTVHPITRSILHVDFLQIRLDQPVDVDVPFITTGKAAGVVEGGIMRQVYRRLPVRCLPEVIPISIGHDISALGIGDTVKASELALPPGVTVRLPPDRTVAGVVMPEKEKVEETAVVGEAGVLPEGTVAAPGAPGAAPGAPGAPGAAPGAPAAAAAPAPEAKEKRGGKEKRDKR
jgi:large subunit ribosomal protein L25